MTRRVHILVFMDDFRDDQLFQVASLKEQEVALSVGLIFVMKCESTDTKMFVAVTGSCCGLIHCDYEVKCRTDRRRLDSQPQGFFVFPPQYSAETIARENAIGSNSQFTVFEAPVIPNFTMSVSISTLEILAPLKSKSMKKVTPLPCLTPQVPSFQ